MLSVIDTVVVLFLATVVTVVHCSCPCESPSLCDTIKNTTRKEIYVFSLQNKPSSWDKFDWGKVTTVVSVGYVSAQLMCLAHKHGARVATIGALEASALTNATLRAQWVKNQLEIVQGNYYDGINIDFEDPIPQDQDLLRASLTALVKETMQAFKQACTLYQVVVDVAWSPACIDQRCYDYKTLADNSDYIFIMAYDEQSQIFGDQCIAKANSDYNKTINGLQGYVDLGVPKNQMVLGVPWYGYNYTCLSLSADNVCSIKHVPFRGVNCSDAAGRQVDYRIIYPLLVNHSSGGRHWDDTAKSPFFNYKEPSTGQMQQIRYDDPQSLRLKYKLAESWGLRGVGTWNIDCLDFSDAPYAQQQRNKMFDAFPDYPR